MIARNAQTEATLVEELNQGQGSQYNPKGFTPEVTYARQMGRRYQIGPYISEFPEDKLHKDATEIESEDRKTGAADDLDFLVLPRPLKALAETVRSSRSITQLEANWDGEGSMGCTEETWRRAAMIIVKNSLQVWRTCRKTVAPPRIMPDLEGGIDIHWEDATYELLLNVPSDRSEPATFFGNNRTNPDAEKTFGQLGPEECSRLGVATWLAQMV